MPAEVVKLDGDVDYRETVRRAAKLIRDGGLVGFPTETVYGVGARADSDEALAALREVKGRVETKPFTLHIGDAGDVLKYASNLSGMGKRFVRKAWPGPITLIFDVTDPAEEPVVQEFGEQCVRNLYHEGTIGVRCPDDRIASDLLVEAGVPVVAASGNRAGEAPPHTAAEVFSELGDKLDLILDGGTARYATSSTVVKLTESGYDVLREGVIDGRMLKRYRSLNILFVCSGNTCRSPMAAAMCKRLLAERLGCSDSELGDKDVNVYSAGSCCMGGSSASDGAAAAMSERSIDLSRHVASSLDEELIRRADHVYCMTRAHIDAVLSLDSGAVDRVELLGGDEEICDPFGGSVEVYKDCAAKIFIALKRRMSEVQI